MQSLSLISLILPLPSFSEPASGLQQPLVPGHVLNGGKWRSVKRTRTLSSTSSGMCSNWPFIHLPPSIGHELGPREHGPSLTRHCRSRPWQGPWCILGTKQVNVHGRIFDSYNCVAAIARLCPSFPPSHSWPVSPSHSSPLGHSCALLPISFMSYALSWSSGLRLFLWRAFSSCSPLSRQIATRLSPVTQPTGRARWAQGLWWGCRVEQMSSEQTRSKSLAILAQMGKSSLQ